MQRTGASASESEASVGGSNGAPGAQLALEDGEAFVEGFVQVEFDF